MSNNVSTFEGFPVARGSTGFSAAWLFGLLFLVPFLAMTALRACDPKPGARAPAKEADVTPAASAAEVRPVSKTLVVTVAQHKGNGKPWDALEGPPDIAVCVTTGGKKWCSPSGTGPKDVHDPYCRDKFTCKIPYIDLLPDFEIDVIDVDLSDNDLVGHAQCRASDSSCRVGLATVEIVENDSTVYKTVDVADILTDDPSVARGQLIETTAYCLGSGGVDDEDYKDTWWIQVVVKKGSQGPVVVCETHGLKPDFKPGQRLHLMGELYGRVIKHCSAMLESDGGAP